MASASTSQNGGARPPPPRQSRITTTHACSECKRRKVRCDGKQPCHPCASSRYARQCVYREQRKRVIPSYDNLQFMSQGLDECKSILDMLFPQHSIAQVASLDRDELVSLLHPSTTTNGQHGIRTLVPPPKQSSFEIGEEHLDDASQDHEMDQAEASDIAIDPRMMQAEEEPQMSQTEMGMIPLAPIMGPVDALDVISESSCMAALLYMRPELQSFLTIPLEHKTTKQPPRTYPSNMKRRQAREEEDKKMALAAYFDHVHKHVPLLDENTFWKQNSTGPVSGPAWLALKNAVLAAGNLVLGRVEHKQFYDSAADYLPLPNLLNGRLETVQAIGILGCFYLPATGDYEAALRLLALARQYCSANDESTILETVLSKNDRDGLTSTIAFQRLSRVLYCKETWLKVTWNVREQPPNVTHERWSQACLLATSGTSDALLIQETALCEIANKIRYTLTYFTSQKDTLPGLLMGLDNELTEWQSKNPHTSITFPETTDDRLTVMATVLGRKWSLLKLLVRQPIFLSVASSNPKFASIANGVSSTDVALHDYARQCASFAQDILQSFPNHARLLVVDMWSSSWLLFHAYIIYAISLLSDSLEPDLTQRPTTLEAAFEQLKRLEERQVSGNKNSELAGAVLEVLARSREAAALVAKKPLSARVTSASENLRNRESDTFPFG